MTDCFNQEFYGFLCICIASKTQHQVSWDRDSERQSNKTLPMIAYFTHMFKLVIKNKAATVANQVQDSLMLSR